MKILIDTNVILDILGKRAEFYRDSFDAVKKVYENHTACVTTTTITDVVYLSKKLFGSKEEQKKQISLFFSDFKILPVTKNQIKQAFASQMTDFEDAVQAFCAKKARAKIIITRNVKDFQYSPVKAITPTDFLKQ
ncbi:MAG: PIN domain-containing protein [Treponema sp.]|nr:PIN domain-containing protein [Treponema sp.]